MKPLLPPLAELGRGMASCDRCAAASTARQGTPPRCLWAEEREGADSGVIVVGLNPGRASPEEIGFYEERGLTYEATVEYLVRESPSIPYFIEMRRFVQAAFGSRSIHWTEIAKCELRQDQATVPLDMRRTCMELHLKRELRHLSSKWPVVAAGRIAFEAMAVLCTDRPVVGVPHPTGSFGRQFSGLFDRSELAPNPKHQLVAALQDNGGVWLVAGEA